MKTSPNYTDNLDKQRNFTVAELKRINEIEQHAIARFYSDMNELESALGMLRLGYHVGWRVLYINHSKATIRKYEKILGINVKDEFPEEGNSAYRHRGLAIAKKIGNFWKLISGEKDYPTKKDKSEKRYLTNQ
tara:strand:- start:382157 stop:382555 length:399 start_codon:yes stop_codon:yes gene_type:complete